jgi:hypothetical protein
MYHASILWFISVFKTAILWLFTPYNNCILYVYIYVHSYDHHVVFLCVSVMVVWLLYINLIIILLFLWKPIVTTQNYYWYERYFIPSPGTLNRPHRDLTGMVVSRDKYPKLVRLVTYYCLPRYIRVYNQQQRGHNQDILRIFTQKSGYSYLT